VSNKKQQCDEFCFSFGRISNQEVRFRWITSQTDAKFIIRNVYIGADCPWFCSGHGLCQSNGCL
jgi:hypothetical protein